MVGTILGVVLGFSVGVFTLSNAIFPVFWAWPRATRMQLQGRLAQPIPALAFLSPAVLGLTVTAGVALAVEAFAPSILNGFLIGLALAFVGVMRKFMVRDDSELYVDFASSYGRYFVTPTDTEEHGMAEVLASARKPTHREYLLLIDRCLVVTVIDMDRAYRLSEQLPLTLRFRSFTLGALWFLSLPAALAASFLVRWWVGPVVLFTLTVWLFRWAKAATAFDVIAAVEANEKFYDFVVSRDLVTLQYPSGAASKAGVEA